MSYYLRVIGTDLSDWMANSSPPLAAYCTLIACRLVVMDKHLGVNPIGIIDTLFQDLSKLVLRVSRYQAKNNCSNLQLCTVLEAIILG